MIGTWVDRYIHNPDSWMAQTGLRIALSRTAEALVADTEQATKYRRRLGHAARAIIDQELRTIQQLAEDAYVSVAEIESWLDEPVDDIWAATSIFALHKNMEMYNTAKYSARLVLAELREAVRILSDSGLSDEKIIRMMGYRFREHYQLLWSPDRKGIENDSYHSR